MFVKPFRVKSNTQMKGSDKKKFRADLKTKFPSLTDEMLASLIPNKDEVIMSKVYTHGGESLLVYYHQKTPLFFELEKDRLIFPTVYTLWRHPDLLLSFPTWPPVMQKIANGADLMLPGIVVDYDQGVKAYHGGKIQKGDPISINLVTNKATVAVGRAYHSSEDMYMAGRRGKGVQILHFYGDQLWTTGTRQQVPDMGPPEGLDFINDTEENAYESDDEEDEGDRAESSSVPLDLDAEQQQVQERLSELTVENDDEVEAEKKVIVVEEVVVVDTRSPQEIMDDLLEKAFLQAWKTSAKKAELPMLTSNFFRVHMVAQCPRNQTLDVKKSSHKKLSKFLAEMQKEKVIEVKELQKGVESITKVDLLHPKIQSHRVVKDADKDVVAAENAPEVLPCDKPYEPPKILELFMVSAAVLPLFKLFRCKKGDGFTGAEVRDAVKKYAQENNLQNADAKGKLNLDPVIAGIVLGRNENGIVALEWEEATRRLQAKMSAGYSLQFPGHSTAEVHKGHLDPIELSVVTRSGNKKVTLVHNLDLFRIDPSSFARKCQVGVAASTSVHEAANRRPGSCEVLVQGSQTKFISKLLLEEYRIPRKYITGLDESKAKKKGQ